MSEEEYEVETILEKRVRKGKVTFIIFLHILVFQFILVFFPRNIAVNVKAIGLNVCFRVMFTSLGRQRCTFCKIKSCSDRILG